MQTVKAYFFKILANYKGLLVIQLPFTINKKIFLGKKSYNISEEGCFYDIST